MPPAARILDHTAHGGTIVFGELTVLIGGKPAARRGDPQICPLSDGPKPHVGGVVIQGSMTVRIGHASAARLGDLCGCGGVGVPGMAGKGVPPVVGPAPPGAPPKTLLDSKAHPAGPPVDPGFNPFH